MPTTKAQQRAVDKYVKRNYDRIEIKVPKGQKDIVQAHAAARGESVNGFIGRAINEQMSRDDSPESTRSHLDAPQSGAKAKQVKVPTEETDGTESRADGLERIVPEADDIFEPERGPRDPTGGNTERG